MTGVKQRTYEILKIPSAPGDFWGRAFDTFIITLIALNATAVVAETVPAIDAQYGEWLDAFEMMSLVVFLVEFALRFWSITASQDYQGAVKGRLRFLASPFAIIDILAILPAFFVGLGIDLRFIRTLRVLRVLKIGRYSESIQILGAVLRRSGRDLGASLFLVMLALLLVSSFMYYAEHERQPEAFSSIPRAMWWGIVALTTTGYGDVVPLTPIGRILGGITSLLGVATIALPVGILSSAFVEEVASRRKKAKQDASQCPRCGEHLAHAPHP